MDPAPYVRCGDVFPLGSAVVDRDSMLAFATLYDPQPFHLDEVAASASVFRGLVASGLQSLSVMHGLAVRSGVLVRIGAVAGLGIDKLRLSHPVRPDDALSGSLEVLDMAASRSHPGRGIARCRITAINQRGETVLDYEPSMLVEVDRWIP